jgi:hypothetical protein
MSDPHNGMDIIDSRDIIKRIEELESEEGDIEEEDYEKAARAAGWSKSVHDPARFVDKDGNLGPEEWGDWQDVCDDEDIEVKGRLSEEDAEELKVLKALAEEAEGYSGDWHHGETLIRESHFEDYAQELAKDIGAIKGDEGWPLNHIDWEAACNELKHDYIELDFDGVTYLMRTS